MFQDSQSVGAGRATVTAFPRKSRAMASPLAECLASGLVLAPSIARNLQNSAARNGADTLGVVTPDVGKCSSAASSLLRGGTAFSATPHPSERVTSDWVRPIGPDGIAAAGSLIPAVLTLPGGWRAGDPATVMVAEQPWPEQWRTELVAKCLRGGARAVRRWQAAAEPLRRRQPLPDECR